MTRTLPTILATLGILLSIVALQPARNGTSVPQAEALQLSSTLYGKECSDGLPPACQQCSEKKCITSCFGDHHCDMDRDEDGNVVNCTWTQNACKPLDAGFRIGMRAW